LYSKQFFHDRFKDLDQEELVGKLASPDLSDAAREAVVQLLADAGAVDVESRVHQARKDAFLRTGVTNDCDFCGKSAFAMPLHVKGQRFCGIDCFHTSRLRHAAVDIPDEQALALANRLREGPCPVCERPGRFPDVHESHDIGSMFIFTRFSTESRLSCRRCANKANLMAALFSAVAGWWSLKGLFATPVYILRNLGAIAVRRPSAAVSPELVDMSRLMMAEQVLEKSQGGRWSLRP
jgi:hypothetical protein